jgi:hypothetical protein
MCAPPASATPRAASRWGAAHDVPQSSSAAQLRFEDEDEDYDEDGDAIDGIRNAALVVLPFYAAIALLIWWM